MEPMVPYIFVACNEGTAFFAGYTYEKNNDPAYARFLVIGIDGIDIHSAKCHDHIWAISHK